MPSSTIGIDIGGTKVSAARFDDAFNEQVRVRSATPREAGALADAAIDAARRVWHRDVIAVGIGVAGLVHWPDGVLVWVPHVSGANVDFRTRLGEALGVPVIVDNDANVAALAEFELGAARAYDGGVLITVGTGIGGGFVVDGEIFRGASFAGELGHMRVAPGGETCPCGNRGCWETLASGAALGRLAAAEVAAHPGGRIAASAAGREPRGEDVAAAARAGDPVAGQILHKVGTDFGMGLGTIIAALDPEVIVVGGGVGSLGDVFLDPARAAVRERLYGADHRPPPPILSAAFGPDGGMVGAALAAWREVSWRFRFRERRRRVYDSLRTVEPPERGPATRRDRG